MADLSNDLFDILKEKARGWDRKIVFPEALDPRVLAAAGRLAAEEVLTPVLIGNMEKIQEKADEMNVSLDRMEIYDPAKYVAVDEMVASFVERRKGKVTESEAQELLLNENYFGTMLVFMNKAHGLVSGAVHSTADTVRPALQIIKMKPGLGKTSGVFIMVKGDERYVFADCAINIAPEAQDLAEIAVESAKTATMFDIEPRVAMLSFSTKGSAVSDETKKVETALQLAREMNPELIIDGEFQFDAAIVPAVAKKKAPNSPIQGDANVFIFPSLEAGNIGYKIAQRLGGFEAIGPILQGLNSPVNDLSRGCSEDDVYNLALVTAVQSLEKN
ncbi:phosphate acetyltransferase [Bacillus sp. IITD106]|nr:phosphate acetyltransferase [Bacillus sp. IITD106]